MPSRQKREWIRHLTAAKLANTQELTLMKTNQHSLFRYMIPINAPPTANQGHISQGENQTTQNNKAGKPQTSVNTAQTISHTIYKQQITCSHKRMSRKEPMSRTESPLPEGRVGWQGVILRGSYSHMEKQSSTPPIAQTYGSSSERYAQMGTLLIGTQTPQV